MKVTKNKKRACTFILSTGERLTIFITVAIGTTLPILKALNIIP
ncbi:MAG: hypothetical protein ABI091_26905 [Ferruginibacter sp.]